MTRRSQSCCGDWGSVFVCVCVCVSRVAGCALVALTGEISWGASSFVGLPLISVIVSSVGTGSLFFGNAIAFGAVALGFYGLLYWRGPK